MKYLSIVRFRLVTALFTPVIAKVCVALIAIISYRSLSGQIPMNPATGLINVAGAAFDPAIAKGYIVDSAAGAVHIINDTDRSTRTIKVGANPT